MSQSTIEKYDKYRYNIIKWFTVGFAIWYGRYLLTNFTQNETLLGISALVGLIGSVIWAINLIRFNKISKIINADVNLKNALNDELIMHNRNKSIIVGYVVLMIAVVLFMAFSIFTNITTQLVCQSLLYLGVLSVLIASLVYNR